jgi:hypothetical protein
VFRAHSALNLKAKGDVQLNRKMLAELAVTEPFCFQALTEFSKTLVPWKNRNADRMTMQDFDEIKKGEWPAEWDPKNYKAQAAEVLQKRVAEQFANVCLCGASSFGFLFTFRQTKKPPK